MAKKKARSLPFVVQPRLKPIVEILGTEESGQIEIARKGYLSVAEKAWVQAMEADDDTQGRLHRLALKMGAELDMDPRAALDLIGSGNVGDPRLAAYQEELLKCLSSMQQFNERRKLAAATCLLINRVDSQWTIEDSLALHTDLLDALYLLYTDEDAKSVEALEAALATEDEGNKKAPELGKD